MKFHSLYQHWELIFVFKTEHYWNPTRAKQIMFTTSHPISLTNLHYIRASKTITLKRLQTCRRGSRLMSWVCLIFCYETMIDKIRVNISNQMEQSPLLTVMVQLWSSTVYCLQRWYSCDPAQSIAYSNGKAVIQHGLLLTVMVQLWSRSVYCLQWWYSCDAAQSVAYSDGTAVIQDSVLLTVMVQLWSSTVCCLQWWYRCDPG